jgi:hypothetical protein
MRRERENVGIMYLNGSWSGNRTGVKSCLAEQTAMGNGFAVRLRTARGRDFGFDDLSRSEILIPRKVRKKATTMVVVVMRKRFLNIAREILPIILSDVKQILTLAMTV